MSKECQGYRYPGILFSGEVSTITKLLARRNLLGVIFSPFLVSQAQKRETSPDTTGKTSEDESKGVRCHEERRVSSKGIIGGARADRD